MREVTCPQCGLSIKEFNESGRFGCSECYRAFANELSELLRRIHGHDHHTGKIPAMNPAHLEARKELLSLRRKLKRAVEQEDFELAAQLRDSINDIERMTELQNFVEH